MADKLVYQSGKLTIAKPGAGVGSDGIFVEILGNLNVDGSVFVQGDTIQVDEIVSFSVADAFIILNFGETGPGVQFADTDNRSGLMLDRGQYSIVENPSSPGNYIVEREDGAPDGVPIWRDDPQAQGIIDQNGNVVAPGPHAATGPATVIWNENISAWNFQAPLSFRTDQTGAPLPTIELDLRPRLLNIGDPLSLSDIYAAATAGWTLEHFSRFAFKTIKVSGQSDIVADNKEDVLTIVGSTDIVVTTNASTDTLTITHANTSDQDSVTLNGGNVFNRIDLDGRGHVTNLVSTDLDERFTRFAFRTVTIDGTSANDIVAEDKHDTLNIRGGISIDLSSAPGTDTLTITHANTSDQDSVTNTNGNVIQSVDLNDEGHVTSLLSTDLDLRFSRDAFKTIKVSGQGDIVADNRADTLTVVAGTDIVVTTNASTDTLTITHANTSDQDSVTLNDGNVFNRIDLDGRGHVTNLVSTDLDLRFSRDAFKTIKVSGQGDIVADNRADDLTIVGSTDIVVTTNASSDTLTITHADTSDQDSVTNTDGNVFNRIDLDGRGHVTNLVSTDLDERFSQDAFKTIKVSGQNDIVADNRADDLTVVGGTSIDVTTNSATDTLTITHANTSDQDSVTNTNGNVIQSVDLNAEGHVTDLTSTDLDDRFSQFAFKTIKVSGQNDIVADNRADDLTFASGTGITLTNNSGTGTLTITNSSPNVNQCICAGSGLSGGGNGSTVTLCVDNTVVRTTGNQSISGTKTFTGTAIVPTPTSNTHAANKLYVDECVAAAEPNQCICAGAGLTGGGSGSTVTLCASVPFFTGENVGRYLQVDEPTGPDVREGDVWMVPNFGGTGPADPVDAAKRLKARSDGLHDDEGGLQQVNNSCVTWVCQPYSEGTSIWVKRSGGNPGSGDFQIWKDREPNAYLYFGQPDNYDGLRWRWQTFTTSTLLQQRIPNSSLWCRCSTFSDRDCPGGDRYKNGQGITGACTRTSVGFPSTCGGGVSWRSSCCRFCKYDFILWSGCCSTSNGYMYFIFPNESTSASDRCSRIYHEGHRPYCTQASEPSNPKVGDIWFIPGTTLETRVNELEDQVDDLENQVQNLTAFDVGAVASAYNTGSGEAVFSKKVGTDLEFKTLVGGGGIELKSTNNEIQLIAESPNAGIQGLNSASFNAEIPVRTNRPYDEGDNPSIALELTTETEKGDYELEVGFAWGVSDDDEGIVVDIWIDGSPQNGWHKFKKDSAKKDDRSWESTIIPVSLEEGLHSIEMKFGANNVSPEDFAELYSGYIRIRKSL